MIRRGGTAYLGRDLPTALMESVFHKHRWLEDATRSIALKDVRGWMVRAVEDIDLVDHVDWPRFVAAYRIGVEPHPRLVEADGDAP